MKASIETFTVNGEPVRGVALIVGCWNCKGINRVMDDQGRWVGCPSCTGGYVLEPMSLRRLAKELLKATLGVR